MNPLPNRIIEVYNEGYNRIGVVEFDGKRRAIYLSLVPEAQAGDYVRFHAGFAIERTEGIDHGMIVRKGTERHGARIIRLVRGNPLIMKEMAKHVPDAGAYAPVTVLVDERADGVCPRSLQTASVSLSRFV
jgi:hydrogenase maturation factor